MKNKAGNPILDLARDVDAFTAAYIECALWSSTDESTPQGGEPMDQNYSWADLSDETLAAMIADCERFQKENAMDLDLFGRTASSNGHDFWLTRNGHGAGFWDRYSIGEPEHELGKKLSDVCDSYGECNLYIGDDGKIYHIS